MKRIADIPFDTQFDLIWSVVWQILQSRFAGLEWCPTDEQNMSTGLSCGCQARSISPSISRHACLHEPNTDVGPHTVATLLAQSSLKQTFKLSPFSTGLSLLVRSSHTPPTSPKFCYSLARSCQRTAGRRTVPNHKSAPVSLRTLAQ